MRRICVKQKGTYNNVQDTNGELRREFSFTWGLNPAPLSSESKIALLTIDLLRNIILNIIQKVMQPPFTLTNVLIELSTVIWGGKLVVGDIYSYVNFFAPRTGIATKPAVPARTTLPGFLLKMFALYSTFDFERLMPQN